MRACSLFKASAPTATALILCAVSLHADPGDDLIRKGDIYYDRLQASEALKYYLPAEELQPRNCVLLTRIAREYRHLMSDASKDEERRRLGGIAVDYSRRAVAIDPNDPDTQLALAISLGKVLPLLGNKQRVEASQQIKSAVDRTLRLDPQSDLGWHILGRWNLNLAEVNSVSRAVAQMLYGNLPKGSYDQAATCFQKAIELNPRRLMHYIELGRTYSELGRKEEAKKMIRHGLALPNTEKDDPETKEKGRAILEKLE